MLDNLIHKEYMTGGHYHTMKITLDGESYLIENSAMQKVKEFLGAGFDAVLTAMF